MPGPSRLIFDEFNVKPDWIDHPDFIKKRILIISYINSGHDCTYIAKKIDISEGKCKQIINIFTTYGLKAILIRDFDLTRKKEVKNINLDKILLIKNIVRYEPPAEMYKWTYNAIRTIINNSGLLARKISLEGVRMILLSHNIDLNEWKSNPIIHPEIQDIKIIDLINNYKQIEIKSDSEFDFDIVPVKCIINDLLNQQKALSLLDVFLIYREIYNIPKLSLFKFTKLLRFNLPIETS